MTTVFSPCRTVKPKDAAALGTADTPLAGGTDQQQCRTAQHKHHEDRPVLTRVGNSKLLEPAEKKWRSQKQEPCNDADARGALSLPKLVAECHTWFLGQRPERQGQLYVRLARLSCSQRAEEPCPCARRPSVAMSSASSRQAHVTPAGTPGG